MSNTMALAMEGNLVARNAQASMIDTAFNTVHNGIQAAMCSDCCSSNGNSCDPRDDTYEPQ